MNATPLPVRLRLEALHCAALGLWLGGLVTVSATAALAFPTMKGLAPALPGFRVAIEEHPSIAAGHIMNPAFMGLMVAGVVLGAAALLAWRRLGAVRRLLSVLSLLLALGTLVGLGRPMAKHLDEYWTNAKAGELEVAAAAKSAFDGLHPWSSRALGSQAVLVAVSLGLGVWRIGSRSCGASR